MRFGRSHENFSDRQAAQPLTPVAISYDFGTVEGQAFQQHFKAIAQALPDLRSLVAGSNVDVFHRKLSGRVVSERTTGWPLAVFTSPQTETVSESVQSVEPNYLVVIENGEFGNATVNQARRFELHNRKPFEEGPYVDHLSNLGDAARDLLAVSDPAAVKDYVQVLLAQSGIQGVLGQPQSF